MLQCESGELLPSVPSERNGHVQPTFHPCPCLNATRENPPSPFQTTEIVGKFRRDRSPPERGKVTPLVASPTLAHSFVPEPAPQVQLVVISIFLLQLFLDLDLRSPTQKERNDQVAFRFRSEPRFVKKVGVGVGEGVGM